MEDDGLRGFLRTQLSGVNHNLGIRGRFVRIRNTCEFFYDPSARLGIQALAVALFTNVNRSRHVNENEPAERLDHLTDSFTGGLIRSNRSAHRNPAVLRDLGRNVADAADVDVAVLFRESKFGRQVLADQVAVQKGNRTSAGFEELCNQRVRDGRFSRSRKASEENRYALLMPRRIAAPQFLHNFGIGKPAWNIAAFIQTIAQLRPRNVQYLCALRHFIRGNVAILVL